MQLTTCNPCSDAAGHELCFISHPKHERRISCDVFGTLRMPESWRGWEVWRFDKLYEGSGKFVISSWVHDDKVLCSDEVGGVFTASKEKLNPLLARVNNALWETWRLEPIMPVAISGKKIWSLVSIGATATATAVAMPFAVMGAVGYLGFGAGGIAAGSIGAGMMSAEAIAAGGGVAVGGTVATLQSIGAAGLGVAGTSAAAGTGAVVGGSLGVFTANKGLENEHAGIRIEEPETHLPLCAWRMWK